MISNQIQTRAGGGGRTTLEPSLRLYCYAPTLTGPDRHASISLPVASGLPPAADPNGGGNQWPEQRRVRGRRGARGRRDHGVPGHGVLAAADHGGARAVARGHPLQRLPRPRLALPLPAPRRRTVRLPPSPSPGWYLVPCPSQSGATSSFLALVWCCRVLATQLFFMFVPLNDKSRLGRKIARFSSSCSLIRSLLSPRWIPESYIRTARAASAGS